MSPRFSARLLALTACGVFAAACGQPIPEPATTESQALQLTGADGDLTVTDPATVLNRYAALADDNLSAGATSLQVTNAADLDHPTFGPLAAGDLVFIIQMQGATIDTSDTAEYGKVTSLNGAGLHEFAVVRRVEGNTLHLACSGLLNSYTKAGRTQVVRVPQLRSLTVAAGASVVAAPWDGDRGGVVVLHVEGTTTLTGQIDVSGQGFRAGARDEFSRASAEQVTLYCSTDEMDGAEKGEGIAGYRELYDAQCGRYGRGAPANGGGGGNSHNAGGGGGANGNNGRPWLGNGVMRSIDVGAAAWQLDPAYVANGNALTDESGGGRGGYTFSSTDRDALVTGPNDPLWGGNLRTSVGGLGGRPLDNNPTSRLFLGGGGGAGDGNNMSGAAGGYGGGLVYLISSSVDGTGSIRANGGNAQDTTNTHNDAPGGGGGGGSIVVLSSNLSGISAEANGGQGGRQLITTGEAEGPGGGGGGGYVALSGGSVTTSVAGGGAGSTTSTSLIEFPSNGSTTGATGQVVVAPAVPQPWLSCSPIDLGVTVTNGQTTSVPGTTVTYTVTVTNAGPGTATNAPISVPIPANATGATWTCAPSTGASCQATSGTGAVATNVTLPPGGTATFTFVVDVSETATGTLDVTATASEPSPNTEVNPADNSATDSDTLVPAENAADLSVTLIESSDPAPAGSPLNYTVRVANAGPDDAENVTVTFPVPAGSTYSGATGTGWSCAEAAGVVTCTRPNLPDGSAPDITITVIPTTAGTTLNAQVSVSSETADPSNANNSDSETTAISPENAPPVNTVPAAPTTPEDTPLIFSTANGNAISIADPDAGSGIVQVTLTVTHGTLTLGSTEGVTFTTGDGTSDTTMTFTGTPDAINAALQGLGFTPDANYNGGATLTITTNDQGNTGAGGPKSDTDTVAISVTPVNDPPRAENDTATVPSGTADRSIDVLTNDSSDPDSGETLTVTAVTPGSEGGTVTIADGGSRVIYTPAPGFTGTETFTYTISDGNGGTVTATVTITVTAEDFERRVVGSGCSASGGNGLTGALWVLLALVGFALFGRRDVRKSGPRVSKALVALGGLAVLGGSTPAQAQASGSAIDVQQFKPAPGKEDVLGLHGAGVPGNMNWRAGLYLNYAHDPLVVINPRSDTLLQHLVKNQLGFDFMGAIGLGERFEVGAVLPLNLQNGEFDQQPNGNLEQQWKGGIGDLRLVPKALLLSGESLRLALAVPVVLPTGGATALRGQDGVGVQPRVAADYAFEGGTRLLANVGINLRSRQELLNLSVGNELAYGLGAAIPFRLQEQQFTGLASLGGALGLGATGGADEEEIPLEVQAGLQYHFSKSVLATLGLGRGLTLGYGMPVFRVFTGVSWTAEEEEARPPPQDTDGDGIPDPEDACPTEAEDRDNFQDDDGCPDPDNDGDGILDVADKCPMDPEDKDGFQDEDGCPDPDNDQDGIVDGQDKCPLKPEDKDTFQDADGCPDPDNDRDGFADAEDKCPLEAEVINGVTDEDGCPDEGKPAVQVQGKKILILEKVHFDTNKDVVLARSFPLLQQVAAVLRANPQLKKVRIEGHTDDRGNDAFNMDLSQRRANNVRKHLVEQAKIAPERLESVGYGETQPVDTNKTAAGRENNRRVIFTILEVEEEAP